MSISTKEKIKSVTLSLFAQKGYDGTTMSEIANLVGIKKASLYAHFSGKEDLIFSVYEDLAQEYVDLMNRIISESDSMDVQDKLYYMFKQYISYYIDNPEIQAFWNQITLFTPPDISHKFYCHASNYDLKVQQWIETTLSEGINQGLIINGDTKKMAIAYRALREGLLNGMMVNPELNTVDNIKSLWEYFWFGIKGRG
ncbi:MAG: transcriptional regulator, TetR family [Firmicutes bacterium]|nr:transcriptional regulator, TetR family [Bacillota bacterium]